MLRKNPMPTNRNFGIVFFIVFLSFALWPLLDGNGIKLWSLITSLVFLILGIFNSKILTLPNKLWMKFGLLLGGIVAPIVMCIVFFLVVTPTGFILRLFGKDVLMLKNDNRTSYWLVKDNSNNDMRNQF
tara:strand:- start:158 stop:544 length:387 start_codon:yes stop_codon:yes gene_type:complete